MITPVTEVVSVKAGVAPPEDEPVNPFAEATETAVTVPVPGVNPRAVVTSPEVRVIAPVRVLKLVTGVPEDAAVRRPLASTVREVYVYDPAVTAVLASVVANDPVPEPVTSPVRVIVWSPVFVPLRLLPDTVPDAATELGVIAPNVSVIAGVVVDVATVPDTPFAVETETEVTEPVPGVYPSAVVTSPLVSVIAPVRMLNEETPVVSVVFTQAVPLYCRT